MYLSLSQTRYFPILPQSKENTNKVIKLMRNILLCFYDEDIQTFSTVGNAIFRAFFQSDMYELQMQFSWLWLKQNRSCLVRWESSFMGYLFSVPLLWIRSSKAWSEAESIVQKWTKFGLAVLKGSIFHGFPRFKSLKSKIRRICMVESFFWSKM